MDEGGQKVQIFIYKINTRDIMCNMINIINTAVWCVWKLLRANSEFSSERKYIYIYIFHFFSVISIEDEVASPLVAKKIVATNAQSKNKASPASVDNVV